MGPPGFRLSNFVARFTEHFRRINKSKEPYMNPTESSFREFLLLEYAQHYSFKNATDYSARLTPIGDGFIMPHGKSTFLENGHGDFCPENSCCVCMATMFARVRPLVT